MCGWSSLAARWCVVLTFYVSSNGRALGTQRDQLVQVVLPIQPNSHRSCLCLGSETDALSFAGSSQTYPLQVLPETAVDQFNLRGSTVDANGLPLNTAILRELFVMLNSGFCTASPRPSVQHCPRPIRTLKSNALARLSTLTAADPPLLPRRVRCQVDAWPKIRRDSASMRS